MAQLTEHLSKSILARNGLPVLPSVLVRTADEAAAAAAELRGPVVVKAQMPAGRRGKRGGIKVAMDPAAASAAFAGVTAVTVDGLRAVEALVEPRAEIGLEYYLAVALDGAAGGPVVLFGTEGGIEVETAGPPLRCTLREDGSLPAGPFRRAAYAKGTAPKVVEGVLGIAQRLAAAYHQLDARLIEVNPLAVDAEGRLIALDARIIVDDHALFRQPELKALVEGMRPRPEADVIRDRTHLEFVRLRGRLGLISGGAGMTMAVMDLIDELGGSPACFMDCSANPTLAGYGAALDLLLGDAGVDAILISIFGGLTHVDRVAKTLVTLLKEKRPSKPVTIRLMGTNVEGAEAVLTAAGLENVRDLRGAVRAAVATLRRSGETVA